MPRTLLALLIGIVPTVWSEESRAADDEPPTTASSTTTADQEPITPKIELRHDLRLDLIATGALAVVTVGFRLVRDDMEPSHCRICDGDAPGQVNAVDDWFRTALRRPDHKPANYTSYVLAFGAAPISAVGLTALAAVVDRRSDEVLVDILALSEGGFSAMLATEILESVTLRQRPYVHAMANEEERNAEIAKTGAFHSFPAGHVVETFGVAAASGVVASMRGYRLAPLVWVAGMMLGVATAYTRIASDRHYFTDVLAGAAIGTVVGGGVPLLFHRPVPPGDKNRLNDRGVVDNTTTGVLRRASFMATPIPRGQMVGVGWFF